MPEVRRHHAIPPPIHWLHPSGATFTGRTCQFPPIAVFVVDHRAMDTIDPRFRPTTPVADTVDVARRWPSLSLIVDSVQGIAGWMLVSAGGWVRDVGSSTQLGPDPEQVTGRATGART
jgi:hypothetical protein